MSYDLAIWHQPTKINNERAVEIYLKLIEEDRSDLQPSPMIDAFYTELTKRHPEINDIPEAQIGDHDLSPWSSEFDRSDSHLIITSVWSKADYVANLIFDLARQHQLSVFDPQSETINYPDSEESVSSKPWWKFW